MCLDKTTGRRGIPKKQGGSVKFLLGTDIAVEKSEVTAIGFIAAWLSQERICRRKNGSLAVKSLDIL